MTAPAPASLLIVDDDAAVRKLLRRFLEGEGFTVTEAADGAAMKQSLAENPCDLVLLDINLGCENGLDLLRDINERGSTPVIFISGKGDVIDRVVGLELGADDYIAKPFELREVLARVRSVLRRARPAEPAPVGSASDDEDIVRFDGWRFDRTRRTLADPDGGAVELTAGEFNLLSVLLDHPGRPLTRDAIMDALKGVDWTPYDRSIDTQIARLRKKIEADPSNPVLIKSVRGVGYVFAGRVERG